MGDAAEDLRRGRSAYAENAWRDAYAALGSVDRQVGLDAEDLELLATSALLTGKLPEGLAAFERANHEYVARGSPLRAARVAVFLGMNLALAGEVGSAGGWFGRAQRLVEGQEEDCVERGYLLAPVMLRHDAAGEHEEACRTALEAAAIAERFHDSDLLALTLHSAGVSRVKQGRIDEGLGLLDEAMVSVAGGDVSPFFTGIVYCGVIASCEEAFEPRRAREWTDALASWCDAQPQLVSFAGRCLAHRAGIKQLHGHWTDALEEARLARERCEQAMNRAAAGQAYYQQAELLRLQGELGAAEEAYRNASGYGRDPQPGFALLRLAQGELDAATAAIRRVVAVTPDMPQRATLLPAYVEIMLSGNKVDDARAAAQELEEFAAAAARPLLTAFASFASGAVALAGGDAGAASAALRRAREMWQELDAPYEVARTQVLAALACRALGDRDTAELELEAALQCFRTLGALPDVLAVEGLLGEQADDSHGLTPRQLEVLRLVAGGKTNREIAAILVVSEHTVARHVQNILVKLRVSSRTAATAFAFEHELV